MRRCKLQKFARNVLGMHSRMSSSLNFSKSLPFVHIRAKRTSAITGLKRLVQAFYERDDVSRCTTGKKRHKNSRTGKKAETGVKRLAEKFAHQVSCRTRIQHILLPVL